MEQVVSEIHFPETIPQKTKLKKIYARCNS